MPSRKWFNNTAFVTLVLATLVLGGCIRVQIIDRTPSTPVIPSDGDPSDIEEHDLAVLAVDFDPPLEYDEIMARKNRGEGITLLVAVENAGDNIEQDVKVEVQLSGQDGEKVFLHKEGGIETIVPGEIKIVQFRDADIPFSYEYQLQVSVNPVPGEVRVSDNLKTYDLLITEP